MIQVACFDQPTQQNPNDAQFGLWNKTEKQQIHAFESWWPANVGVFAYRWD